MRSALRAVLCLLVSLSAVTAQTLWTGWETPAGSRPGRPGLQSPVLKSSPIPETQFTRAPGRDAETVDWLCSIEADGRVNPIFLVTSRERKRGGRDDQARDILKTWRFTPGVFNGKPARVGVVLSVPFGEGRPQKDQPKPNQMLRDFMQGMRSAYDADVTPMRLMGMPPVYPDYARQRGRMDDVQVAVEIREDGRVGRVLVLQAFERDTVEAVVTAVKEWVFLPAMANGAPVTTALVIRAGFQLVR